ncbi:MAG: transposase [Pseudomonadota bacterium]
MVDGCCSECLALVVDISLFGLLGTCELDALIRLPGKPIQKGFVESFNCSFLDEWLKEALLLSLVEASSLIPSWKEDYNQNRPRSSLSILSPCEFALKTILQTRVS